MIPATTTTTTTTPIPGILILTDNRTYGRSATNNRLLYRCIPNDKSLSPVLIPYKANMGFSKVKKNLYILFTTREKTSSLVETIGEIDMLEHFYEYQLYCRSIKYKQPSFSLTPPLKRENITIECPNPFIFTIDNPGTIDYDDAFSIETHHETYIKINIYIANVPHIFTKHHLWQHFHIFQERTASIYLPNKKIPLFPTKLSELCSLTAGQERPALVFSLYIDKKTRELRTHFTCEIIRVSANYVYDATDLLSNTYYIQLLETVQSLSMHCSKSNDLVETLMILMGTTCAKYMDNGIYLFTSASTSESSLNLQHKSQTSLYVLEKPDNPYMCITSPIRRIVDIANMAQLILTMELEPDMEEARIHIENVKQNLLQLNHTTKSIKKVQSQCKLYHLFKHQPQDKIYIGLLFDKRETNIPEIYSYSVYLTEYKFMATIKSGDRDMSSSKEYRFKLYLLNDATTLKQKIRLQIVGLC